MTHRPGSVGAGRRLRRDGMPTIPSTESVPTLVRFADGEAVATVADGFQGTEAVVAFPERNAPGRVESVAER